MPGALAKEIGPSFTGGVAGTVERQAISQMFPVTNVESYKNSLALFEALVKQDIQAAIEDWSTVMLLGRELGMTNRITVCEVVLKQDLRAIILKDRPKLLAIVDAGLSQITQEEHRYIVNNWFIGQEEDDGFFKDAVMPVGITVLLSFCVWMWAMRRRPL